MKLYHSFFLCSFPAHRLYPPAFQVLQVEWKTSFMRREFWVDTLISGGRRRGESIVWNHNIQGYALIQNEEENIFQQSCLSIRM